MKTFLKIIVAAIVAMVMACVLVANGASGNAVVVTYFFVAIMVATILGVFDVPAKKRDMKHASLKDAARYGEAA